MAVSPTVHLFTCTFLVAAFAWLSAGKDCQTLDGKWYNQLGSEIFLRHENDGRLLGEYRTAVERKNGSAGETHSILLGEYENLPVYNQNFWCVIFWSSANTNIILNTIAGMPDRLCLTCKLSSILQVYFLFSEIVLSVLLSLYVLNFLFLMFVFEKLSCFIGNESFNHALSCLAFLSNNTCDLLMKLYRAIGHGRRRATVCFTRFTRA